MAFIGAVALIVIGPERLPGVARTAGYWVGKGRRMLNEVKADIKKEIREQELQDLKELQQEMDSISSDISSDIKKAVDHPDVSVLKETEEQLRESASDVSSELNRAGDEIELAKTATTRKKPAGSGKSQTGKAGTTTTTTESVSTTVGE